MTRAKINGAELFYEEQGAGEPLLFHHGYTGSHDEWTGAVAILSPKYRCIVMDCRGAGDSEHTAGGYTIKQYAADALGLMDYLDIPKFTFIGHSMGGAVGMQLGIENADRLDRLVLVAPAPADGVVLPPGMRERARHMRAGGDREQMLNDRLSMDLRGMSEEMLRKDIDRGLSASEGHFEESAREMESFNAGGGLSSIETPTLVVSGAADFLLTPNLKDFQRLPNATLHVFSRVGHLIPREITAEFAATLDDFLTHGVVNGQTQMAKMMSIASGR